MINNENKSPVKDPAPLRILQITQFLEIGGLESLVIDLSSQLKTKGIEVELLCLNQVDEQYAAVLREKNIPIHVIPEQSRLHFNFFRQAAHFIRENNFDVVHAHSGCHLNAAIFTKLAGVDRFVYTAHGMPLFTGLRDRLEDTLAAWMTSTAVSVSYEIDDFLQQWFWLSRCKFRTIINGIDTNAFRPLDGQAHRQQLLKKYSLPADRILFGSVGRLATIKNYPMVLHTVKRLVDGGVNNIGFVLVGEGSRKRQLEALTEKLGISDFVYFLGMQYNINEILPLFRFFVLSSLTEGTSISLLESQSCGIPAVVTDVGGNRNVISPGKNGFLCPLNDNEKMAEYMQQLINNPELSATLGTESRTRVEQGFSIDTMTNKYLQIYKGESVPA